jgi:hypothetical protein
MMTLIAVGLVAFIAGVLVGISISGDDGLH